MGRGNVCSHGEYEGLYYIDNDHYVVYREENEYDEYANTRLLGELSYKELTSGNWYLDEEGSADELEDIEECFIDDFTRQFPSFMRCDSDKWIKDSIYGDCSVRAILENGLFYIGLEDNEWSMALKLIQKEDDWGESTLVGFQKRFYQRYLEGMKKSLLNRIPSIGIYVGAWISGRITKEKYEEGDAQ